MMITVDLRVDEAARGIYDYAYDDDGDGVVVDLGVDHIEDGLDEITLGLVQDVGQVTSNLMSS